MAKTPKTTQLTDAELEQANGGVGLLLPAVQSAREAASTKQAPVTVFGKAGSAKSKRPIRVAGGDTDSDGTD